MFLLWNDLIVNLYTKEEIMTYHPEVNMCQNLRCHNQVETQGSICNICAAEIAAEFTSGFKSTREQINDLPKPLATQLTLQQAWDLFEALGSIPNNILQQMPESYENFHYLNQYFGGKS
jgi:hypothetical protein